MSAELIIGNWYTSKRGSLVRLDSVNDTGIVVTSHMTGRQVLLDNVAAKALTPATKPENPPGTIIIASVMNVEEVYKKHPQVVPGSIYNLSRGCGIANDVITGTRCKIKCLCGKERDIRLQDAHQVTKCIDCYKEDKKKKLKKFVEARKKS